MALPTISTLPTAPSRADAPSDFNSKADALIGALPTLVSQINAFGVELPNVVNQTDYAGTSTTSLTVGTGSKSLTIEINKNFAVGQAVRIANTATPANYMDGQVTAYTKATGALVVNVTAVGGTGTFTAWTVSLSPGSAILANYAPIAGAAFTGDVTTTGKMGIGTTSLSYKVEISNAAATHSVLRAANTNTSFNTDFELYNAANTTSNTLISKRTDGSLWLYQSGLNYIAAYTNNLERLRIDTAGNVGIGTSTPASYAKLAVVGAGFTAVGVVSDSTSETQIRFSLNTAARISNQSNTDLLFDTNGVERFRITAAGNYVFPNSVSSGNLADAVGYKGLPQNAQTSSYTLGLTDMGKDIYISGTTATQTITIPANASVAFPIGTVIKITNDSNQNWSIAITTDTLVLKGTGSTGTRTLAAFGDAVLEKKTATRWWIGGTGLT